MEVSAYLTLHTFAMKYGGVHAVLMFVTMLNSGYTNREIGARFGITEARVSQLKKCLFDRIYVLNKHARRAYDEVLQDRTDDVTRALNYTIELDKKILDASGRQTSETNIINLR